MRERLMSVRNEADEIVFCRASPAQQKLAWELNGASWAKPMSIENYVLREAHLSNQELTKDGGCSYWILHLKDHPDDIIASCESTRKTLLLRRPGTGDVEEARAYAIASVYTNPAYRRLGMASLMLRRLQEEMDRDGEASALYSDIGKVYYGQLGWIAFPSEQATLELLAEDGKFTAPAANNTTPLLAEDLRPLCDRDVADLKARLRGLEPAGKTYVSFAPSYEQIAWQLAREEFMARRIHGKAIERRGAMTEDSRSWIIWDHDWRDQKLKIQRIVIPGPTAPELKIADTTVLLQAAMEEAAAWGLRKVLVWNPDEITTMGIKGVGNAHEDVVKVVFDERLDGSIPSFRWKGGKDSSNTIWLDNQYYAWC